MRRIDYRPRINEGLDLKIKLLLIRRVFALRHVGERSAKPAVREADDLNRMTGAVKQDRRLRV